MLNKINEYLKREFVINNYPSFYLLNAIGWILVIFLDTLVVSPAILLTNLKIFILNTLEWGMGFVLTSFLRTIYMKYPYRENPFIKTLVVILACSFLVSLALYLATVIIGSLFYLYNLTCFLKIMHGIKPAVDMFTRIYPLITTWSFMYFGIKFWFDLKNEIKHSLELSLLAQNAQLQMLRYQINPHFLFNSFTSLLALIRTDSSKAAQMVNMLSDYFRYSLTTKEAKNNSLKYEIKAVENYMRLEKIRFGDSVLFEYYLDDGAENIMVPTFIFQPLVENALKYGMKTSLLPLTIRINAALLNDILKIEVINSGRWIMPETEISPESTNTGLSNVEKRLNYSYPGKYEFNTREESGNVIVEIIIKEVSYE